MSIYLLVFMRTIGGDYVIPLSELNKKNNIFISEHYVQLIKPSWLALSKTIDKTHLSICKAHL